MFSSLWISFFLPASCVLTSLASSPLDCHQRRAMSQYSPTPARARTRSPSRREWSWRSSRRTWRDGGLSGNLQALKTSEAWKMSPLSTTNTLHSLPVCSTHLGDAHQLICTILHTTNIGHSSWEIKNKTIQSETMGRVLWCWLVPWDLLWPQGSIRTSV